MKIVAISDTHGFRPVLPNGDVLVHCGDWSHWEGTIRELTSFSRWFGTQPFKHKILISGNHDFVFLNDLTTAKSIVECYDIVYLEDSGVEIDGIRFWGSPWQPEYKGWAFGLDEDSIKKKWNLIPMDIDVLLTHSPPAGILDSESSGKRMGCPHLRDMVIKVRPKLHVFGHIHEGHGLTVQDDITYINASICGRRGIELDRHGDVVAKMQIHLARLVEI